MLSPPTVPTSIFPLMPILLSQSPQINLHITVQVFLASFSPPLSGICFPCNRSPPISSTCLAHFSQLYKILPKTVSLKPPPSVPPTSFLDCLIKENVCSIKKTSLYKLPERVINKVTGQCHNLGKSRKIFLLKDCMVKTKKVGVAYSSRFRLFLL